MMQRKKTKVGRFERRQDRIISKSKLGDDGLVTANERDSGVAVVHGCFPEGGDSILSVFSSGPLQAKL